jgi:hypothetical protein
MNCRRHGSKSTIAFWMLVAIADLAMLVATAGAAVMISIFAALALVAGGVVAARTLSGRPHADPAQCSRYAAVARRRA